jgi:hypothetical protein
MIGFLGRSCQGVFLAIVIFSELIEIVAFCRVM